MGGDTDMKSITWASFESPLTWNKVEFVNTICGRLYCGVRKVKTRHWGRPRCNRYIYFY